MESGFEYSASQEESQIVEVFGESSLPMPRNDKSVPSKPIAVPGGGKIGLWLNLKAKGNPRASTSVRFFVQLSGSDEGDDWYNLAPFTETVPSGYQVFAHEIDEDGMRTVLPYENAGGGRRLRLLMITEDTSLNGYIAGSISVGTYA